jgi:hypothetical protein
MAAINNYGADVKTEILGNGPVKRTAIGPDRSTATVFHDKIYFPHNILIFCANWGYLGHLRLDSFEFFQISY